MRLLHPIIAYTVLGLSTGLAAVPACGSSRSTDEASTDPCVRAQATGSCVYHFDDGTMICAQSDDPAESSAGRELCEDMGATWSPGPCSLERATACCVYCNMDVGKAPAPGPCAPGTIDPDGTRVDTNVVYTYNGNDNQLNPNLHCVQHQLQPSATASTSGSSSSGGDPGCGACGDTCSCPKKAPGDCSTCPTGWNCFDDPATTDPTKNVCCPKGMTSCACALGSPCESQCCDKGPSFMGCLPNGHCK